MNTNKPLTPEQREEILRECCEPCPACSGHGRWMVQVGVDQYGEAIGEEQQCQECYGTGDGPLDPARIAAYVEERVREANDTIMSAWVQMRIASTVGGKPVYTPGGLSTAEECADYLAKHGLIKLDKNGNEPRERGSK